ncbi:MAG: type II toxin-antitoxin system Phd/YefM family antitoxin [Gammaproteobacteria bacterium]|nr:MAG: type II toxin-antitoxin system Phd/YefM family antitoxin [Gammaproteobacteria bacterium]
MTRRNWPVQDAKARFSELLEACVREGPQIVTRRGEETAVLVPIAEWRRLCDAARPSRCDAAEP